MQEVFTSLSQVLSLLLLPIAAKTAESLTLLHVERSCVSFTTWIGLDTAMAAKEVQTNPLDGT